MTCFLTPLRPGDAVHRKGVNLSTNARSVMLWTREYTFFANGVGWDNGVKPVLLQMNSCALGDMVEP